MSHEHLRNLLQEYIGNVKCVAEPFVVEKFIEVKRAEIIGFIVDHQLFEPESFKAYICRSLHSVTKDHEDLMVSNTRASLFLCSRYLNAEKS